MDSPEEQEPTLDRAVGLVQETGDKKKRRALQALFKDVFDIPYTRGRYIVNHKSEFLSDYQLICEYVPYFEADADEMEPWQDAMEDLGLHLVRAYDVYTRQLVVAMKAQRNKKNDLKGWMLAMSKLDRNRKAVRAELYDFKQSGSYDAAASHNPAISGSRLPGNFVADDEEDIDAESLPSSDEEDYSEEESFDDEESEDEDPSEVDEQEDELSDSIRVAREEPEVIDLTRDITPSSESEESEVEEQEEESPESPVEHPATDELVAVAEVIEEQQSPLDSPTEEIVIEDQYPNVESDSDSDTHININDGVTIGVNRTLADYPYYQTSTIDSALAWDGTICFICRAQTNTLEARLFFGPVDNDPRAGSRVHRRTKQLKWYACRDCRSHPTASVMDFRKDGDIPYNTDWWRWAQAKYARAEVTARACEACGVKTTSFLDPPFDEPSNGWAQRPTVCHSCELFQKHHHQPEEWALICNECTKPIRRPFWKRATRRGIVCDECDHGRFGKIAPLPWWRVSNRAIETATPRCSSCGITDEKLQIEWASDTYGQPQCIICIDELREPDNCWLRWRLYVGGECSRCDVAMAPLWHIVEGGKGTVCHWCMYPNGHARRFKEPFCVRCRTTEGALWYHRTFTGKAKEKGLGEVLCSGCVARKRPRDDDEEVDDAEPVRRTSGIASKRRKLFDPFVFRGGSDDPLRFFSF